MKKEELKSAIKQNFENNEFANAMELNKDLFAQYETVAGKRSLASLITYHRKKAGAMVEVVEEEDLIPADDPFGTAPEGQEEVTSDNPFDDPMVGGYTPAVSEKPEESTSDQPQRPFRFILDMPLDPDRIAALLEEGTNETLNNYCIIREYFFQKSDEEREVQTLMYLDELGYGWTSFDKVVKKLGGKKGKMERKAGSLGRSQCGLPVGEMIISYSVFRIGDALRKFAFRDNDSKVRFATKMP